MVANGRMLGGALMFVFWTPYSCGSLVSQKCSKISISQAIRYQNIWSIQIFLLSLCL